jgi:hypothetical protein
MVQVSDCCRAPYEYVEGVMVCLECGEECGVREVPEPEDIAIHRAERRGER